MKRPDVNTWKKIRHFNVLSIVHTLITIFIPFAPNFREIFMFMVPFIEMLYRK